MEENQTETHYAQQKNTKYCSSCGEKILEAAVICPKCGVQQATITNNGMSAEAAASDKTKIAAGLFALLLGGFGAHKFYLGQKGKGILYLLLCWTGIPSIIALIEGIVYLTSSDEAFYQKYVKK